MSIKFSQLPESCCLQTGDIVPIVRSGSNYSVDACTFTKYVSSAIGGGGTSSNANTAKCDDANHCIAWFINGNNGCAVKNSVNSLSANFSTEAATATNSGYACTAGTATNSGYACTAGTATNSCYAINAGNANTAGCATCSGYANSAYAAYGSEYSGCAQYAGCAGCDSRGFCLAGFASGYGNNYDCDNTNTFINSNGVTTWYGVDNTIVINQCNNTIYNSNSVYINGLFANGCVSNSGYAYNAYNAYCSEYAYCSTYSGYAYSAGCAQCAGCDSRGFCLIGYPTCGYNNYDPNNANTFINSCNTASYGSNNNFTNSCYVTNYGNNNTLINQCYNNIYSSNSVYINGLCAQGCVSNSGYAYSTNYANYACYDATTGCALCNAFNNSNTPYCYGSGCASIQAKDGSNNVGGSHSGVLGGVNNNVQNNCSFAIGANITSTQDNTTYVNNLATTNSVYSSSIIGGGSEVVLTDGTNTCGHGDATLSLNFCCGVFVENNLCVCGCIYGCGISGVLVAGCGVCSIQPSSGNNTACGTHSSILGGVNNVTGCSSTNSVVAGGGHNSAIATIGWSAVLGGGCNTASGEYDTTVSGGYCNIASGNGSSILGGICNTASGTYSIIGGGSCNCAAGYCSTITGGHYNKACGNYDFIGGGNSNSAYSTVFNIGSNAAAVLAGWCNAALGDTATTVSGAYNLACNSGGGFAPLVVSGRYNCAISGFASVVGGCYNTASGYASTVSGGSCNTASGNCSAILGGCNNQDCGNSNVFILGSNICANNSNYTYVNAININGGCLTSDGTHLYWNGACIV
jgi:hypothetical protein